MKTIKSLHTLSLVLASLLLASVFFTTPVIADETVDLTTRGDVTQRILWMPRDGAVVSVILFAGGTGRIKITDDGDIRKGGNFLVRSRHKFANHKLNVAVFDAPSDHYSKKGMKVDLFRDSKEHTKDIEAVINYVKKKVKTPVWVVGTSRGTESAANVAINLPREIDGLILTASMSEENRKGVSLPEMELSKITVPTLIISHEDDACHITTPEGSKNIKDGLTKASKVELKYFSGGDEPTSKPCKAKSAHGFLGIEGEVVDYIVNFIKTNSR
jgi:pimeloyl-ACP methyl ester carboxylesterase